MRTLLKCTWLKLGMTGYAPDDEMEEQDRVDILLTWKQTRAGINQTKLARGFGASRNTTGKDFKKLESRVRCFRCKQVGHFSRNCPKKGKGTGKSSKDATTMPNNKVTTWSNDYFEPEQLLSNGHTPGDHRCQDKR